MKRIFSFLFMVATSGFSHGAVLSTLPSAMAQGGMVHIDVVFKDQPAGTFSSSLEFGGAVVPELKPFTLWRPGDSVNPLKPWFDEIDPTQSAMQFSSRWGFRIDTDNSDPRPAGASLALRMTSSTPGLGAYFYSSSGAGTFQPVFLTPGAPHDYVLWSGVMWHPYFTMPSGTAYGSAASATFEFFLADTTASGDVDWTTSASALPGYSLGTQTITWTAVPEPGTAGMLVAAGAAVLVFLGRRRRA